LNDGVTIKYTRIETIIFGICIQLTIIDISKYVMDVIIGEKNGVGGSQGCLKTIHLQKFSVNIETWIYLK